jgi:glucose-6-phosphate dehydrogenase assembly protein OpcA
MIGELPKFVWWKATPNPEQTLFHQLTETSNCIIVDSSYFSEAESELLKMQDLTEAGHLYCRPQLAPVVPLARTDGGSL